MSKFKMDDHVRITDPTSEYFDQVGRVAYVDSRDLVFPYNVRLDESGYRPPFREQDLTLADPDVHEVLAEMAEQSGLAAEEKADPGSLKSGDRVMVLGHVGMYGGRFGMIHSHSGAGASVQWLVRLEGNPVSMPFSEYELTLAPRKDMAEQEIDGEYDRTRGMPAAPFDNPLPNRRAVILRTAESLVNGQRADDYGPPAENFGRVAAMWSAQFAAKLKEPLTADEIAIALVHLKLSRLANTPDHADSFIDAAGYIALAAEIAEAAERP